MTDPLRPSNIPLGKFDLKYVHHSNNLLTDDSELSRLLRGEQAPAVLLPYQQRWICDKARVRIFEKSRRIGITYATAADCVLEAASGKQDVWYVAYSEDGGKEFLRDCAFWCGAFKLVAPKIVEVMADGSEIPRPQFLAEEDDDGGQQGLRALQVKFPSGKRITALTSNPRNLRGKQGRVIIDEAAFHNDLAELLKAAFALLMWGGEVWVLSTHNGTDNAFAQLVNEVRDGKKDYSLHTCTITDAIDQGLYDRICTDMFVKNGVLMDRSEAGKKAWLEALVAQYGDGADEELFCKPTGSGTSYIGQALIVPCEYEAPVIRYDQTDEWLARTTEPERVAEMAEWCEAELGPQLELVKEDASYQAFAFGLDFARVSDLTVACPMGITQQLQRRVPFMLEMRNVPFNQQWQAVRYIMENLPHLMFSALDAGGNGSWVAEQAWLNFGGDDRVERVQLSLGYYRDNMPALRQAFEDRILRIPRDADVRRDISQIRRVNGIPKVPDARTNDSTKKAGLKRHGDAAIALFLANVAARSAEEIWLRWRALSTM